MTIGLIPSHEIANKLMALVDWILDLLHLNHHTALEEIIYTALVIAIAGGIGWLIRRGIVGVLRKAISLRKTQAGRDLLQQRTITKCSHIIPPLIFMALIPVAFQTDADSYKWITRIAGVYTLVCFACGLNAVITFLLNLYINRHNTENHPL
ncbi:MAG: hypothetical protein K2J07_02055, partial [Muribaculaceae bacterium]|nr:hypothetical protein [Muribaculaceae bacterium]